ncbi:MAG: hypothetical protein D6B26_04990, partial [Spirochaetaceae bacterium]
MNKGKIIIRVAAALLVLVLTGCASALHQSGYYRNQIDPQYPGSDFMRVDQEVLKMSGRQNVSMEQLADQLGAIAATDWEKARAIHTWIVRNLEFDRRAFTQELEVSCDADDVLSERKTLSCGYAALFQRLAEELGLESELIQGYVKDSRYEGFDTVANNHAWNIVTIDGQSAIIDTAWAAGQARDDDFSKDYDEYYFNPPPQQLIFSHYPEQQARQLLDEPLSREEYFRLPQIPPHAFDRGVNLSLILERTRDGKTITMPIFYEVDNPYYLEEF